MEDDEEYASAWTCSAWSLAAEQTLLEFLCPLRGRSRGMKRRDNRAIARDADPCLGAC